MKSKHLKKQERLQKLERLIFKVSDSSYKLYLQKKQGIRPCCGVLSMAELKELTKDIELLEYFLYTKNPTGVDIDKLFETLT